MCFVIVHLKRFVIYVGLVMSGLRVSVCVCVCVCSTALLKFLGQTRLCVALLCETRSVLILRECVLV